MRKKGERNKKKTETNAKKKKKNEKIVILFEQNSFSFFWFFPFSYFWFFFSLSFQFLDFVMFIVFVVSGRQGRHVNVWNVQIVQMDFVVMCLWFFLPDEVCFFCSNIEFVFFGSSIFQVSNGKSNLFWSVNDNCSHVPLVWFAEMSLQNIECFLMVLNNKMRIQREEGNVKFSTDTSSSSNRL